VRRNSLQQQQRDDTRQRITQAALKVFFERGYVNTTIEHVLKEASVSRAAFYKNFDGKLAVVFAIAEEYHPQWQPIFQYLADLKKPDMDGLEHWARLHLKHQQDNIELCTLLTQVTILEPQLYQKMAVHRHHVVEMMAANHPAFAAALRDADWQIEAHTLLFSLNHICFHAAQHPSPKGDAVTVRILARQMLEFMTRGAEAFRRIP
jgi:AcrR family transcriptional regulator